MAEEAHLQNLEESTMVAKDTETPVAKDTTDAETVGEDTKENPEAEAKEQAAVEDPAPAETAAEQSGPDASSETTTKQDEPTTEEVKPESAEDEKAENKTEKTEKSESTEVVKGADKKETTEEEVVKEEDLGPFNGVFIHTESENLEPFLIEMGIGWFMRKIALNTNPTTDLQQKGNEFVVKFQTGPMKKEAKFTLGVEYDDKDGNGELATVSPRIEDGKLIQYFEPKEGSKSKPLQITRSIEGDILTQTMEIGNVKCVRTFKRKS